MDNVRVRLETEEQALDQGAAQTKNITYILSTFNHGHVLPN